MPRRVHHIPGIAFATLLAALGMRPPAAAVDLSGDYVVTVPIPCRVTVIVTGTEFQVTGSCELNATTIPFSASGTVDPATGAFSGSTDLGGICRGVMSGTGDGELITGTGTLPPCLPASGGPFAATKCGNGVIDPQENCDDGNQADGDCCSARCRAQPTGAVCAIDGSRPCAGFCDDVGRCGQVPVPARACSRAIAARDVERCMATQCEGIDPKTCRRRCKPAAIRTLAYVVSECEAAAGMVVGRQDLRIRREDREPVTVVEFPAGQPSPDPVRQFLCLQMRDQRFGAESVAAFPLQRLGVSPDGAGIVFEVNDQFSPFFSNTLTAEQRGFFFVRADGQGLRRLGPPSREPSFGASLFAYSPPMSFSPNGRRIVFTDRGPGPAGEDAPQIVILDLTTGQRTQVTRLPDGIPPPTPFGPFLLTCCPVFVDEETIRFQTHVDPDGLNPEHDFASFNVRVDGTGLERISVPLGVPGSEVVPSFSVGGGRTKVVRVSLPGIPVSTPVPPGCPDSGVPCADFPITEVFLQDGKNLVQLTNFRSADTFVGFMSRSGKRAFFMTSVDPLGTNPYGDCQIFSVNSHGGGLRQVTHFNQPKNAPNPGCFGAAHCSVGEGYYRVVFQDPVTKAVVFSSSCDPLGANKGSQLFAIRPDGRGLRQLTDAAGVTQYADGSFRVELVGPFAYSAAIH